MVRSQPSVPKGKSSQHAASHHDISNSLNNYTSCQDKFRGLSCSHRAPKPSFEAVENSAYRHPGNKALFMNKHLCSRQKCIQMQNVPQSHFIFWQTIPTSPFQTKYKAKCSYHCFTTAVVVKASLSYRHEGTGYYWKPNAAFNVGLGYSSPSRMSSLLAESYYYTTLL